MHIEPYTTNFEDVEDAVWDVPATITKHFTHLVRCLSSGWPLTPTVTGNISLCVLTDLNISYLEKCEILAQQDIQGINGLVFLRVWDFVLCSTSDTCFFSPRTRNRS